MLMLRGAYLVPNGALPFSAKDCQNPFFDYLYQCADWPVVGHWVDGILTDLTHLGVAVKKLAFWEGQTKYLNIDEIVITEIEYILIVCRSTLDLLQELMHRLWLKSASKLKLEKTFAKMVLENNLPMPAERIKERHSIPDTLAQFYAETGPFVEKLRNLRDRIVHGGGSVSEIIFTDRGFGVIAKDHPFEPLGVWLKGDYYNENVASLRTLVAFIVWKTIFILDAFAKVAPSLLKLGPPMAPGLRVWLSVSDLMELHGLSQVFERKVSDWRFGS